MFQRVLQMFGDSAAATGTGAASTTSPRDASIVDKGTSGGQPAHIASAPSENVEWFDANDKPEAGAEQQPPDAGGTAHDAPTFSDRQLAPPLAAIPVKPVTVLDRLTLQLLSKPMARAAPVQRSPSDGDGADAGPADIPATQVVAEAADQPDGGPINQLLPAQNAALESQLAFFTQPQT